jgi:hypothetical protein
MRTPLTKRAGNAAQEKRQGSLMRSLWSLVCDYLNPEGFGII